MVAAVLAAFFSALCSASCVQAPADPEMDAGSAGSGASVDAASYRQNPRYQETSLGEAQSALGSEPLGEAEQEVRGERYEPEDFHFVVTVQDDGEGKAGGWQVARNVSSFVVRVSGNPVYRWDCRLTVEMPLRSEEEGRISPARAAMVSATIANDVTVPLLKTRKWVGQGAVFCLALKNGMNALFRSDPYKGFGARVTNQ